MTFQQLQYLLEVHKAGSFSKAAKNLYVTTASVSIAIGNLEKELGYPLFIRTPKGLALTANGQKILDHATHICERHRQMGMIQDSSFNALTIAINDYIPAKAAARRLIVENAQNRNTSINVYRVATNTIEKIAFFEIDIGIISNYHSRNLPLQNILKSKGLAYRVLDICPVGILIGKGHRLYYAETIDIKDLERDLFIDSAGRGASRSHYLKGIVNIPQENVVGVHFDDLRYELLSQGVGYSITSKPSAEICRKYSIRCIPLENVYSERICVTNPTRPLNQAGKRFLELLDEEIENQRKSRFD